MIVVKLMDGLGNQLFQYSYARFLQSQYNEPISFDLTRFKKNSMRSYALSNFNIKEDIIIPSKLKQSYYNFYSKIFRTIHEKFFNYTGYGEKSFESLSKSGFYSTYEPIKYYPFFKTKKNTKYVRGYFQSEKYFESISEEIKNELTVKSAASYENRKMIEEISMCESVCVHIRRGDYSKNKQFEVCTEKYYLNAINFIKTKVSNPIFYIFSNTSDDIEWIKQNYNFDEYDVKFVDLNNPDYEELRLMYNCKHFIISNSTFSWWAQYLSKNKDKIVVAPIKWSNAKTDYDDIYMNNWHVMEV